MNKIEIKAVIKHFCKKDFSFQNIYKDTLEVLGDSRPSYQVVKSWGALFEVIRKVACAQISNMRMVLWTVA
jgi:hypothetical protein